MASLAVEPEAEDQLISERDVIVEDVPRRSHRVVLRRMAFAVVGTAVGAVTFASARRRAAGPQTLDDANQAEFVGEVATCRVQQTSAGQWCLPAKPIGDVMRASGRNSPQACAETAAADPACGAFINYNPQWEEPGKPGSKGGCHCVFVGSGNEGCGKKEASDGWSIYTAACVGGTQSAAVPPAATAAAAVSPVQHHDAPLPPQAVHHPGGGDLPPIQLEPSLVQAGRCSNPSTHQLYEETTCDPVKLLGEQMRGRTNSLASCAAVAAADPGCGNMINYSPGWGGGQGACHCVDERNLKCDQRSQNAGFAVYSLSCQAAPSGASAGAAPAHVPAPTPPPHAVVAPATPRPQPATPAPPQPPSPSEGSRLDALSLSDQELPAVVPDHTFKQDLSEHGKCYRDWHGEDQFKCFCELAGNGGCPNTCSCPGGCNAVWRHELSSTFLNLQLPSGCPAGKDKALLTIPSSYVSTLDDLHSSCNEHMVALLHQMVVDGFTTFVNLFGQGTVMHCIHASDHTSVPWLHLHTFCGSGTMDGMPHSPPQHNDVSFCIAMDAVGQASAIARRIVMWAGDLAKNGR